MLLMKLLVQIICVNFMRVGLLGFDVHAESDINKLWVCYYLCGCIIISSASSIGMFYSRAIPV